MMNTAMTARARSITTAVLMLNVNPSGPASIARVRSQGHIYNTIRHGRRRMPNYKRIPPDDRWDIVNYIQYLNEPGAELW